MGFLLNANLIWSDSRQDQNQPSWCFKKISREDYWGGIKYENKEKSVKIYVKFRWGLEEATAELKMQKQIPAKYRAGYTSTTVSGIVVVTKKMGDVLFEGKKWRK